MRCKGYVNEGDFHIMYAYQITMLYTLNIILFIKYMSIKSGGLRNDFFLLRLWSSSFHPERSCFLLHLGTPSGPFTPPRLIGVPTPKGSSERRAVSPVARPLPDARDHICFACSSLSSCSSSVHSLPDAWDVSGNWREKSKTKLSSSETQ